MYTIGIGYEDIKKLNQKNVVEQNIEKENEAKIEITLDGEVVAEKVIEKKKTSRKKKSE